MFLSSGALEARIKLHFIAELKHKVIDAVPFRAVSLRNTAQFPLNIALLLEVLHWQK